MLVIFVLLGCQTDFGYCEWEQVEFTDSTWGGSTPQEWAEPFLGSWTAEPTWLSERRPPVGVAEIFQVDLRLRDEPVMVQQIVEHGNCDPTSSLQIPMAGSVQSLDGAIRAVHSGSEQYWMVSYTEEGDGGLSLRGETKDGSLEWSEQHFTGDAQDGHYWRFFLSADGGGGSLELDHYVRNDEVNKASSVWSAGQWYW